MLHSNSSFDSNFSSALPIRPNLPPPPPSLRSGPGRVHKISTIQSQRGLPPPRVPEKDKIPIGALARNDKVTVLINGRGWAIGIILAVLEALDSGLGIQSDFFYQTNKPGKRETSAPLIAKPMPALGSLSTPPFFTTPSYLISGHWDFAICTTTTFLFNITYDTEACAISKNMVPLGDEANDQ
ncbi:hypothetical protein BDZ94DRAFT_1304840 [Collybia nuda]|uniref:Uncharacterized protein n=1 Tax=Collybia nuda TaxID=64659 RepID=A0A9P6CIX4_9AGAR|nr:hypothetical protein BDZ94DRAFT_1304840 [Collybia nuda]